MSAEGETKDVDMGDASAAAATAAVDEVRRDRCAKRRVRAMVSSHGTRSVRAHCSDGGKAPCIEYNDAPFFRLLCVFITDANTYRTLSHVPIAMPWSKRASSPFVLATIFRPPPPRWTQRRHRALKSKSGMQWPCGRGISARIRYVVVVVVVGRGTASRCEKLGSL
jgi:hypothetical protein